VTAERAYREGNVALLYGDGAGGVSKADIASAVHEAVTELAPRVPPARWCLIYSIAGAMVSTEVFGRRYVLQCGGYSFEDRPGVRMVLGAAYRPGHVPKSRLDLHAWFTELPPGADPEDAWSSPPWLKVIDLWLRHLGPVRAAAGVPLARALPDFVWGPVSRVRAMTGIEFRPDRPSAVRLLTMATEGPETDYWQMHLRVAEEVARSAARKLGVRMTTTTEAVVPGSFLAARPGRVRTA
jgi:hypothetical protein